MLYRVNVGNYKTDQTKYAWGEDKFNRLFEEMMNDYKSITADVYRKNKWVRIYGKTLIGGKL